MRKPSANGQTISLAEPAILRKAQRSLARRDPVLRRLIAESVPCTLGCSPARFQALPRSIISQQISTKAARTIQARLEEMLAPASLSPQGILALSDEARRRAGLSAAKARSLCDL